MIPKKKSFRVTVEARQVLKRHGDGDLLHLGWAFGESGYVNRIKKPVHKVQRISVK